MPCSLSVSVDARATMRPSAPTTCWPGGMGTPATVAGALGRIVARASTETLPGMLHSSR